VPRYPLISVHRLSCSYRKEQNYSIHKDRHWNWPTNSGKAEGVTTLNLGRVNVLKMPMAWSFHYQIDHFSMRPDSQALFMQKFMRQWWRTGGGPQLWLMVNYPGWNKLKVRMILDGDIENTTPLEPEDGTNVAYRTSVKVTVEGYIHDAYPVEWPTFWTLVIGTTPLDPDQLHTVTTPTQVNTVDEHQGDTSEVFQGRDNPPPQPVL
jgi:hypothetical protein